MKTGSKLSLLSLGLALSLGSISASILNLNKNISGAKAAGTEYWLKANTVSEVVNSSTQTRNVVLATTNSGSVSLIVNYLISSAGTTITTSQASIMTSGSNIYFSSDVASQITAWYPPSAYATHTGGNYSWGYDSYIAFGETGSTTAFLNRGADTTGNVDGSATSGTSPEYRNPNSRNWTQYFIYSINNNGFVVDYTDKRVLCLTDSKTLLTASGNPTTGLAVFYKSTGYNVTFNTNGGSGSIVSQIAFNGHKLAPITVPTRGGYTFAGFYDGTTGGTMYIDASGNPCANYNKTADCTLYAHWTANQHQLTVHDDNGGSYKLTATYASPLPDVTVPTKEGYTFTGYFGASNDQFIDANGHATANGNPYMKNYTIDLYPHWTANHYMMRVNHDDFTEEFDVTYDAGWPWVNIPSKPGYTFKGYYNEEGIMIYDDHCQSQFPKYCFAKDLVLTPVWEANHYRIIIAGEISSEEIDVTYGGSWPWVNIPSKPGYTFHGYFDEYGTMYYDERCQSQLPSYTFANDLYLTPSYTPNTYTITFDSQKAKTKGTQSLTVTFNTKTADIEIPLKDNYVFGGYYTDKNGQGEQIYNASGEAVSNYTIPNDTTLYALWNRAPGDYTKSMYEIVNNNLVEDTLTITSNGFTESVTGGSHKQGNSVFFDRPDQFVYRLTGRQPSGAQGLNFVKHADVETTFYIHLDNYTQFNSTWGGCIGFNNRYATYNSDGTISEIVDSTTPIHFVFIVTGDNYFSGHNWQGASFDGKGQDLTIQFATIKGGSINFSSAYHQMASSVPVNFNGMDINSVFTNFDSHTRISEIKNGRLPNLNSYNATSLVNYVKNASNVKKYSCTKEGVIDAFKEQYEANQPFNSSNYYTVLSLSLQAVHNCDAVEGGIEPTCTTAGLSGHYVCADCGLNLSKNSDGTYSEITSGSESSVIEALGHNFVSTITKVATTEEAGQITKTCTRCGYTETVEIPKLPKIDVTEETTPEQEAAVQEAVSNMAALIPDVIDQMEAPVADEMTEEEYSEAILKYEEKQEQTAALNNALEKIGEVNEAATTETTQKQKETIKQAQENVVTITETVTTEKNVLDNEKASLNAELEELKNSAASEEEIVAKEQEIKQVEEKQEIIEVVTTQAVVVTAKQTEISDITEKANLNDVPEDAGLGDMGQVFNDFMQKQIDELLGKGNKEGPAPEKRTRLRTRAEEQVSQGIDFNIDDKGHEQTKSIYQQVESFVDQTVNNASEIANKVRNCTGVESKTEIKLYIEQITSESFRDFNKAKADAEFAENAYKAVLRNMQGQVLTQLEQSKPTGNYEQLQSWQEEYDAVTDIKQFEDMVIEVMRRKFNSISQEITYDTIEEFEPIYKEIFTNWALNKEDSSGITLEQLTQATIDETTKRVGPAIVYKELETSETVAVSIFAALAVTIVASAAIVPTVLKKKRGGVR